MRVIILSDKKIVPLQANRNIMKRHLISLCVTIALAVSSQGLAQTERYVDYRFAPQWHQTTTALPDDSYKTLVGPQGQLLYEHGKGRFFPYPENKGFKTVIHMMADENQFFGRDSLLSAKVPVVVVPSQLRGATVEQFVFSTAKQITEGKPMVHPLRSDREDIILTRVRNTSEKPVAIRPVVYVNSHHKVTVDGSVATIDSTKHFVVSLPVVRVRKNMADFKTCLELEPQEVPAGGELSIVGLYDNGLSSELAHRLTDTPSAIREIENALRAVCHYWEHDTPIPYGRIQVPDREIQNLLDASARGIWQAREIINGNISLQVGPTVYRGLWIVDGAFLSEATAMLGAGSDARAGIEYSLTFQKEDGGFRKLTPNFWKESGLILWTCVRHAMLTRDKDWLSAHWDALGRTIDYIHSLRERSLTNAFPEDDGLIPPGFIDGGLAGSDKQPEYSNTLWSLAGLKAMIAAADWLGKKEDARRWQHEYDDFYAAFRHAAERDLDTDDFGNRYLNNMMKPEQRGLPQRAQWAFCQSIYPGQVFERGDSIAIGTMKMLDATLQEGMVMGTGWIIEGIWNYFASFYGHAWLWNGRGDKAADALYAFANHASPLFIWREEHNPKDIHPMYIGDMPHNWASAEFIRLACHLLELDRGTELHLLEGLPEEWLGAGMETSLSGVATPFGPLSLSLKVDAKAEWAYLNVAPLSRDCTRIVLHTGQWGQVEGSNLVRLNPRRENSIKIKLIEHD